MLRSPRWRRLERSFDQWLSVQKIYTTAEIAELKAELQRRVVSMSSDELEDFIDDTEQRLAVLLSDEAMDARAYLDVFTDRARRDRVARGGEVPQVFDMTVSQLRQELHEFQQRRAQRGAAQRDHTRRQTERAAALGQEQRARRARQQEARRQADARQADRQSRNPPPPPQPARSRYAPQPLVTSEMAARLAVLRGL
jgi:hypothetical protein